MPRAAGSGESSLDTLASSWHPQPAASYPSAPANGLEHSQQPPQHQQPHSAVVDRQRPRTELETPSYASSAAYSSFAPLSSFSSEQQHYQQQPQPQQARLSDAHDPHRAYTLSRDSSDGGAASEPSSMYPSGLPYHHGRSPSGGWSSYDAPPQQQQQQQQQQQPNSASVHGSPSFAAASAGARPVPGAGGEMGAGAGSSGAGADYGAYMSMGPPQTSSSYGASSSLYMHAPGSAGGPGRAHEGSESMGAPQADLTRRRAQTLQEPPPGPRYGASPGSNGQMYAGGMYASPQMHQREQWGSSVDDEQQRPMSPSRSNSYRGTSSGSMQQQGASQARRFAPYGVPASAAPRRPQTGSSSGGEYRMPDLGGAAQGVYAPPDQTSPYAGSSTTSTSSGGGGYFGSTSVDASVARYRANSASSALRSPPIMGSGTGASGRPAGATSTPAPPSFAPSHLTDKIVLRALANSSAPDVHYPSAEAMPRTALEPPPADFDVPDEQQEERLPRQQRDKLRFKGDLYTPTWVRGTGNAREAWCDKCPNGGWMQLKNSQYWYHVRGTHGISPTSGLVFLPPLKLRCYADSVGTTEGLCHSCSKWIQICTAKRKRDFSGWFKHSARCHPATSGIGASAYMRDAVLSQPPPSSSTQLPPLPHHLGAPTSSGAGAGGHASQQHAHSQYAHSQSHSHGHSHSGMLPSGAPLSDTGSYGHLVGGMPAASMPSAADGSAPDHYRHR